MVIESDAKNLSLDCKPKLYQFVPLWNNHFRIPIPNAFVNWQADWLFVCVHTLVAERDGYNLMIYPHTFKDGFCSKLWSEGEV